MTNNLNYIAAISLYKLGKVGDQSPLAIFNNLILKMNEDEGEKWLNTDEAATYLSITPNALRILVHRARVKYFKLGRRLKFRKSDLVRILLPEGV